VDARFLFDGLGFGLEELVIVVEELGRAIAPGPFVPTVIASAVIAAAGDDDTRQRLLPGLADGSTVGSAALGGDVEVRDGKAYGSAGVVLGAVCSLASLALGVYGVVYWVTESNFPGPLLLGALVVAVLGVQGFILALVGEHLGRIQRVVEHRPLYLVDREL